MEKNNNNPAMIIINETDKIGLEDFVTQKNHNVMVPAVLNNERLIQANGEGSSETSKIPVSVFYKKVAQNDNTGKSCSSVAIAYSDIQHSKSNGENHVKSKYFELNDQNEPRQTRSSRNKNQKKK